MSRALPSLGMFAETAPSLVAPMAIGTLALSTSESVSTGHFRSLQSQYNLKHESCSVAEKPFKQLIEEKPLLHTTSTHSLPIGI